MSLGLNDLFDRSGQVKRLYSKCSSKAKQMFEKMSNMSTLSNRHPWTPDLRPPARRLLFGAVETNAAPPKRAAPPRSRPSNFRLQTSPSFETGKSIRTKLRTVKAILYKGYKNLYHLSPFMHPTIIGLRM